MTFFMGHSPGWYAYMQGEVDRENRQKEYEQRQREYAERQAEWEEWREEHLSTEKCPICGSEMYIREGKYGKFLGCSDYPDCKGVRKIKSDGDNCKTKQPSTEKCPKCGGKMYIREGKYGKFLGCSNYPKCKGTRKI